jgi:hypothetical protein
MHPFPDPRCHYCDNPKRYNVYGYYYFYCGAPARYVRGSTIVFGEVTEILRNALPLLGEVKVGS